MTKKARIHNREKIIFLIVVLKTDSYVFKKNEIRMFSDTVPKKKLKMEDQKP